MRPLELALEGFTSFRREQRLDFSELDLFAITGATGSGKSSLLEAMTYALFGTTVRSGKQISDLVSQGSETLKVQLQFAVGPARYRVTRWWRFRRKSAENKVLLEEFKKGEWENLGESSTVVQNRIEQILGMDFDTFTRAIVLPQGKFDEFLKGDTAKRREVLRQLAGFEIFEQMRKEANELAKLFKSEREMVERQLAEVEAPPVEEITQQRSQLLAVEQELPRLNQAVLTGQKTLDAEEQLFKQISRLRELQTELANLVAQSSEIDALAQRLEKAQIANHLQADWVLVKEARNQSQVAENAATVAQAQLRDVRAYLGEQEGLLAKTRVQQESQAAKIKVREEALATAKIYEEQRAQLDQDVTLTKTTQQEKLQALKLAEKEFQVANKKNQEVGFRVAEAEAWLSQHSPGGKYLEDFVRISPLLMELKLLEKQGRSQEEQLAKTAKNCQTARDRYAETEKTLKAAEEAVHQGRAALDRAEATQAETVRLHQAAALRLSLKPGDLCPVCGGVHPDRDRLPPLTESQTVDLAPFRKELEAATQALQVAQMGVAEAKAALSGYEEKELELRQSLQIDRQRLTELRQQIAHSLGISQWTVQDLEQELVTLQESDRKYREAEQQLQQAITEFEKIQQSLQFTQATMAAKRIELEAANAELERRQNQLKEVQNTLFELTQNQPYAQLKKSLDKEKKDLETVLQKAETEYKIANDRAIQATEREKQARDQQGQAIARQQKLELAWKTKLITAAFTEEDFLAAVASVADRTQWEMTIRQHRDASIQLETRLKDLSETIGDRTTDEATLGQLRHQKRLAEAQVKQANDRRTEILTWLQVAEQNRDRSERLLTEITRLTEDEQTYHTLAQNLKSNEFQAYILEHLEAELVANATQILRELTETRYSLKIQDGEYWVEDNWNGGELRRVRTLSGGETFATSLSMAIALSEKLSQGAQLGSLFLDEGFGTLDVETLESVTQILESLRQQDRLIGVITHVRALGERLPVQIKVYKSPQGSRIEVEKA